MFTAWEAALAGCSTSGTCPRKVPCMFLARCARRCDSRLFSTMSAPEYARVLDFWFTEPACKKWWVKEPAFDALIRENFQSLHAEAHAGKKDSWADTADGALALIITLDQFPRNMFRDTPGMFASDPKALRIAKDSLAKGYNTAIPTERRLFMYLPFEHSEDPADQVRQILTRCRTLAEGRGLGIRHVAGLRSSDAFAAPLYADLCLM